MKRRGRMSKVDPDWLNKNFWPHIYKWSENPSTFGPTCFDAIGYCWKWTKRTNGDYGQIVLPEGFGQKTMVAHRFAYIVLVNENLPHELVVCHKCDNPICVNPKHLFEGSHLVNSRDRENKGRGTAGRSKRLQTAFTALRNTLLTRETPSI